MMFRHQVDECIARTRSELRNARKYRSSEYARHLERRLESYHRIREKAPVARIGAPLEE